VERTNSYFQIAAILGLLFLSFKLLSIGVMDSFYLLHSINLIFHEAGHTIFSIFGEFVGFLGGALGQLLIPLIVLFAFLRQGQIFSALLMLWWFGENFIDIAPYIGDAQIQIMPLIGGQHDFAYIIGRLDMIRYDILFERIFMTIGVSIMAISILIMSVLVARTFQSKHTIIEQS